MHSAEHSVSAAAPLSAPDAAFAQSALGQMLATGPAPHRQIAGHVLRNPMRVTAAPVSWR